MQSLLNLFPLELQALGTLIPPETTYSVTLYNKQTSSTGHETTPTTALKLKAHHNFVNADISTNSVEYALHQEVTPNLNTNHPMHMTANENGLKTTKIQTSQNKTKWEEDLEYIQNDQH